MLARLEKELPPNLARLVRQIAKNLKELERQLERQRAEGERRLSRLENQIRTDAAKALRRLEKAVGPRPASRRKKATRRKKT